MTTKAIALAVISVACPFGRQGTNQFWRGASRRYAPHMHSGVSTIQEMSQKMLKGRPTTNGSNAIPNGDRKAHGGEWHKTQEDGAQRWCLHKESSKSTIGRLPAKREIASYTNTPQVASLLARRHVAESPKPTEFGTTDRSRENIGWKALVQFTSLAHRVLLTKDKMVVATLLPARYAALQTNGIGRIGRKRRRQ